MFIVLVSGGNFSRLHWLSQFLPFPISGGVIHIDVMATLVVLLIYWRGEH